MGRVPPRPHRRAGGGIVTAGTDDCFAAVTNSLAAYFAHLRADILGLHASDIEPKPFQPIVTGWVDQLHDHCGGAE